MILAASLLLQLLVYGLACQSAGAAAIAAIERLLGAAAPVSPLGRVATQFLLGLGVLSCIWLLLALAAWFSPFAVGIILIFSLAAWWPWARRDTLLAAGHAFQLAGDLARQPASLRVLALLTVAWMLVGFTSLTLPLSGDGFGLHMLVAKEVAHSHVITGHFFNSRISYFGLQGEMTHAALLSLTTPDAAKLFSWPTMMVGALMLPLICGKCGGGRRGKWFALLALYTSTGVLWWIGEGKIDIYATALGLAAAYWLLAANRNRADLALGALFTAFAVQAKLAYALTLVPILGLFALWPVLRRSLAGAKLGGEMRYLAIGAGAFVLAMLPHIAKNLMLFGSVVGTTEANTNLPTFLDESWYGPEVRARIQLYYPLVLTFGEYFAQYGNLSPLVLAFAPMALLLRGAPGGNGALWLVSIAPFFTLVPWMIAYPDKVVTRYLLVPLLLWIPLAARAAEEVTRVDRPGPAPRWLPGTRAGWFLLVFVALLILWRLKFFGGNGRPFFLALLGFSLLAWRDVVARSTWEAGRRALAFVTLVTAFLVLYSVAYFSTNFLVHPKRTFAYLSGKISECEWQLEWCRVAEKLNQVAAPGARVLAVDAYRYFWRPDLIQCSNSDEERSQVVDQLASAKLPEKMFELGFDYLQFDARWNPRVGERLRSALVERLDGRVAAELLVQEGHISLYKILRPADVPARIECRQVEPPAWTAVEKDKR